MEKAIVEKFLNKQVKMILGNSYKYQGELVDITQQSACIKDFKIGEVWVSLNYITRIEPVGEN